MLPKVTLASTSLTTEFENTWGHGIEDPITLRRPKVCSQISGTTNLRGCALTFLHLAWQILNHLKFNPLRLAAWQRLGK